MNAQQLAELLQKNGLKRTKLRVAMLQHFASIQYAQSYDDLSQVFGDLADKSTLYRNLNTFKDAGLIHGINDLSGVTKYAFGGVSQKKQDHAHFVCDACQTVYCLDSLSIPQLNVPEGFKTQKVQTIIRGICAEC